MAVDKVIRALRMSRIFAGAKPSDDILDEAILCLKEYKRIKDYGIVKKFLKYLEKQEPRAAAIYDAGYDQYGNQNVYSVDCPSCGATLMRFGDKDVESESDDPVEMFFDTFRIDAYEGRNTFCDRCGQKLEWRHRKHG